MGLFEGKWCFDEFYGLYDNLVLKIGVIGCWLGILFVGMIEVDIDVLGKDGYVVFF